MKNNIINFFEGALLAIILIATPAKADVTVIPQATIGNTVYAVPLTVPPGTTTVTVSISSLYKEDYSIENLTAVTQTISQTGFRHVSARVAWNSNDFVTPSPYAPFINSGMDQYTTCEGQLDIADGTDDGIGTGSSEPFWFRHRENTWSSAQTFPVSYLQSNNVYVRFDGYRNFSRLSNTDFHVHFDATCGATVTVTYN